MLRVAIDNREVEGLKVALKQAFALKESGKWPSDAKPVIARGQNLLEVLGKPLFQTNSFPASGVPNSLDIIELTLLYFASRSFQRRYCGSYP